MNRIAGRAKAVLLFALILVCGLTFFLGEFAAGAAGWVMFSGSPHVYGSSGVSAVTVTDRDGAVLLELAAGRRYSQESLIRRATLHWVGDRQGNIATPMLSSYRQMMVRYDLFDGLYVYGGSRGRLELTLSSRIQAAALEAMGNRKGTVAVYNYVTGEILCALSTPTFDPDDVPDIAGDTTGDYDGAYLNRFLQSAYVPGSVFKVFTTAAALETVPDILERSFTCSGSLTIDGGAVTCERRHGTQDLETAFANSCNCAFAQISLLVGREALMRCADRFGITDPVVFDGITTASGNFEVSGADDLHTAWSGIGQNTDQINPCRYLTFLGAVANDGVCRTPHVVSGLMRGDTELYRAEAGDGERIMSQSTAQTLQAMMRNNVVSRYGADHFPGLTVCAKSGTAEVGGNTVSTALFAGFVADEEYPLAFLVIVQEGGYGSYTCVPILSEVLAVCKEVLDQAG